MIKREGFWPGRVFSHTSKIRLIIYFNLVVVSVVEAKAVRTKLRFWREARAHFIRRATEVHAPLVGRISAKAFRRAFAENKNVTREKLDKSIIT